MPTILNGAQAAFAQRIYARGESAITIANTLKVSRATVYRSRRVDGT
jgi:DNA invertase Pin-like site-specific DNA recombinase